MLTRRRPWVGAEKKRSAHEVEEKSAYELQSQERVADEEGAGERKRSTRWSWLGRQELAA
jgi:hypothetical protein